MTFTDQGFETGYISFPGLGLVTHLSENQFFRNDGIVKNIPDYRKEIFKEFSYPSGESSQPYDGMGDISGEHLGIYFDNYNIKCSIIYMVEPETIENGRFTRGHESTHALIHFGLRESLLYLLNGRGFTLNPFERYDNIEDIADIGGLISVWDMNNLTDPKLDQLKRDLRESKRK